MRFLNVQLTGNQLWWNHTFCDEIALFFPTFSCVFLLESNFSFLSGFTSFSSGNILGLSHQYCTTAELITMQKYIILLTQVTSQICKCSWVWVAFVFCYEHIIDKKTLVSTNPFLKTSLRKFFVFCSAKVVMWVIQNNEILMVFVLMTWGYKRERFVISNVKVISGGFDGTGV